MRPWRVLAVEPVAVRSVARSHVGLVRPINEDRVFDCAERQVWAVADGMGGHSGGDLAAQTIIEALRTLTDDHGAIKPEALLAAIRVANQAIVHRNERCGTDAGSTIVAAHVVGTRATIAWVGDSRAYLLRDRSTTQLSCDHSVVQELIDAGLLTVAAAATHPHANVVTRALGIKPVVEIATIVVDLKEGDRLLLCSDGLSRSLQDAARGHDDTLEKLADMLVEDALRLDGSDNISLVCIQIGA